MSREGLNHKIFNHSVLSQREISKEDPDLGMYPIDTLHSTQIHTWPKRTLLAVYRNITDISQIERKSHFLFSSKKVPQLGYNLAMSVAPPSEGLGSNFNYFLADGGNAITGLNVEITFAEPLIATSNGFGFQLNGYAGKQL